MRATGRARRRWRAAAIAAAITGHLVFLLALVASVRHERLPEGPIIEVQLTRPPPPEQEARPPLDPVRPPPALAPRIARAPPLSAPPPLVTPVPPAAAPPPSSPAAPAAAAGPPGADAAARIGAALQAVVAGCRDRDLTPEQRERCREREGAEARAEAAERAREQRRARRTDEAGRVRTPATALVRAPGDDPRNHPVGGPLPVMVGVVIPFGKPPKAITPIPPSTLRGDDDALRPKPRKEE